ncbi:hypothetical protein [uncultured Jatrophihabitans sp.]|uniref:hypothetical protein n=1 Tax=uncultured Jatrophihabitans sp. TaxID=1610747 RepID=UPI0035CC2780
MGLADGDHRSLVQLHLGHLVLLATWLLIVVVVYLSGPRKQRDRRVTRRPAPARGPWLLAAAGATLASGVIHLVVIREHFAESLLYGYFFLVLTAAQAGWAAWVVARPQRALLLGGAAASLAVVVLWLATRTVGIPLGPAAGEKEAFGPLDIAASALELATAACACAAVYASRRSARAVAALGIG